MTLFRGFTAGVSLIASAWLPWAPAAAQSVQPAAEPEARPIVVASKAFAESYLLGEMFAQLLEDRGLTVRRSPGLGSTEVIFQALLTGAVDVYPELRFFEDTSEGDVAGWTSQNEDSLTAGAWEQADPNGTITGGSLAAPDNDATPGPGILAFITQNCTGAGCNPASASDIDFGPTDLISPAIDLSGTTGARISFNRWVFTNDAGTPDEDPLQVAISNDGGSNWVDVPALESNGTDSEWELAAFSVSRYIAPTADVRVRFRISDNPNNSISEAGIDDFKVEELVCGNNCPWDCADGGDGSVGTADLLALLAQWGAGGPCDTDGGGAGTSDLLDLLANWGDCP